MPKALVTGANGFIGSHLVRALVARGYDVNGLVRHTGDLSSLAGVPITLFLGDVRQPETLIKPIEGVDYIFHLGAELWVTTEKDFNETNAQGTLNMFEAAAKLPYNSIKRFLHVSSSSAPGPSPRDGSPLDETAPMRPMSWYGRSKSAGEDHAHAFMDRLPVTIVRPSPVYGEREKDLSQTFPVIASHLHPVLGLEVSKTVMVYVGDLVEGIIRAAESDQTIGETYFLNHPEIFTAGEVVKVTAQAMGKPQGLTLPTPIFILRVAAPLAELLYEFTRTRPPITRDKVKEISERFWVGDPSKAKRDFGWEAQHNLLSGMQITTQAYFEKQRQLKEMAGLDSRLRWLMYVIVGSIAGLGIEITSQTAGWYYFTPGWLVFVVIFGAFGAGLGTIAMLLRKQSALVQIVIAAVIATIVETVAALGLLPGIGWTFAPGWPLGITNIWVRSVVLGFVTAAFVPIINVVMQAVYQQRLKNG